MTQFNATLSTATVSSVLGSGVPGPQGPAGPTGPAGPQGEAGTPGQGVPAGGVGGDLLQKTSASNYATGWTSATAAGIATLAGTQTFTGTKTFSAAPTFSASTTSATFSAAISALNLPRPVGTAGSTGVGVWKIVYGTTNGGTFTGVMPSGGTWAYFTLQSGTFNNAGVVAGGTTVGSGDDDVFMWRIA